MKEDKLEVFARDGRLEQGREQGWRFKEDGLEDSLRCRNIKVGITVVFFVYEKQLVLF